MCFSNPPYDRFSAVPDRFIPMNEGIETRSYDGTSVAVQTGTAGAVKCTAKLDAERIIGHVVSIRKRT
ncbi:unnamed protein product [Victoria cruziana]